MLKFRGDALLLLFEGDGHAERACRAAVEMQWFIEHAGTTDELGRPRLAPHVDRRPLGHRALLPRRGHAPRADRRPGRPRRATFRLEDAAQAGEVLVSAATAAALDPAWLGGDARRASCSRLDAGATTTRPPTPPDDRRPTSSARPERAPRPARAARAARPSTARPRPRSSSTRASTTCSPQRARPARTRSSQQLATRRGRGCDELGHHLARVGHRRGRRQALPHGRRAGRARATTRSAMLRALRAIVDERLGARRCAPGVNRGPAFAGDVGATRAPHVRRHGRHGQPRRAARRARRAGEMLATGDVLDALAHAATRPSRSRSSSRARSGRSPRTASAPPLGVREEPSARRSCRSSGATPSSPSSRRRSTRRACGRSRLVELVGEPGIGKSRLRRGAEVRARRVPRSSPRAASRTRRRRPYCAVPRRSCARSRGSRRS